MPGTVDVDDWCKAFTAAYDALMDMMGYIDSADNIHVLDPQLIELRDTIDEFLFPAS